MAIDMSQFDLINIASRNFIIGSASVEDLMEFIQNQIKYPFDTSSSNYFKKLKKLVTDKNEMDDYCKKILEAIEDQYPSIEFNLEDYDKHLANFTEAVYRFFVKSIKKLTYIFLREYIFNNKNRKALVAEYLNTKLPVYPKEQYGKKENYILIAKLSNIVRDIGKEELLLTTFIQYLRKGDDVKLFVDFIDQYIQEGLIFDHGVFEDIMDAFDESDSRNGMINKLQIDITDAIILPCIEDSGMELARFGNFDPDDENDLEDDEDEDADEEEL